MTDDVVYREEAEAAYAVDSLQLTPPSSPSDDDLQEIERECGGLLDKHMRAELLTPSSSGSGDFLHDEGLYDEAMTPVSKCSDGLQGFVHVCDGLMHECRVILHKLNAEPLTSSSSHSDGVLGMMRVEVMASCNMWRCGLGFLLMVGISMIEGFPALCYGWLLGFSTYNKPVICL